MNPRTQTVLVEGPAGAIEVAIDEPPSGPRRGLALVAHPHPLFGGTMDNKVVQTMARAFLALGFTTLRPNFRGVGRTEGVHDAGNGETDDLLAVLAAYAHIPGERLLAGFSFGSFVQTHVAKKLTDAATPPSRLVLIGTAVTRWEVLPVPLDTVLIHGELDETVPLKAVLDWALPQDLAVTVVPGADHFFHHRLTTIKRLVMDACHRDATLATLA